MKKTLIIAMVILVSIAGSLNAQTARNGNRRGMGKRNQDSSQMFKYSTTIEKERPQLDEETKRLISEYRKNPSDENYNALRKKS